MPNWDKYPHTQKNAQKEREWNWRSVEEAVDLRTDDEGEHCGDVPHYRVEPHIKH